MSPTRVLLVRHGESTWNAVRRWQGQADPPLTERGESQAVRAVEAAVAHGPFAAVASSHLQRARRTAERLAEGLSVPLTAALDDLSERSAGEWEGLTRAEIEAAYPGFLDAGDRPPGYESDESIVERAGRGLRHLAENFAGETLLVVSHGGIIHALERAHSGGEAWQRLDNLTGRWFEIAAGAIVPIGERIVLVPDGGHGLPPPPPGYA